MSKVQVGKSTQRGNLRLWLLVPREWGPPGNPLPPFNCRICGFYTENATALDDPYLGRRCGLRDHCRIRKQQEGRHFSTTPEVSPGKGRQVGPHCTAVIPPGVIWSAHLAAPLTSRRLLGRLQQRYSGGPAARRCRSAVNFSASAFSSATFRSNHARSFFGCRLLAAGAEADAGGAATGVRRNRAGHGGIGVEAG